MYLSSSLLIVLRYVLNGIPSPLFGLGLIRRHCTRTTRPQTRLYAKWLGSVFRLPVEIRVMTYRLLWENAISIDMEIGDNKHDTRVGRHHSGKVAEDHHLFSLLQTCQLVRSEARPTLFEHLTVVLRGTKTKNQQPTSTCLLLEEVRVLVCTPNRALYLDFKNPSRLEDLMIAPKDILRHGMSMGQVRMFAKADLPKLQRLYVGYKKDGDDPPQFATRFAKTISCILVGVKDMSFSPESGISNEAATHVCFTIATSVEC